MFVAPRISFLASARIGSTNGLAIACELAGISGSGIGRMTLSGGSVRRSQHNSDVTLSRPDDLAMKPKALLPGQDDDWPRIESPQRERAGCVGPGRGPPGTVTPLQDLDISDGFARTIDHAAANRSQALKTIGGNLRGFGPSVIQSPRIESLPGCRTTTRYLDSESSPGGVWNEPSVPVRTGPPANSTGHG